MDSRDACLNLNYFKTLTEVGEGHLKGGGMRSSCGGGGGGERHVERKDYGLVHTYPDIFKDGTFFLPNF